MPIPLFMFCHGFTGNGNNVWFPNVRKELFDKKIQSFAPDFPNSSDPRYPAWKETMDIQMNEHWFKQDLYFVGHSMGGYFLMRYLGENFDSPWRDYVKGLIIVSPPSLKRPDFRPFYNADIDFLTLQKYNMNITLIYSLDDPVLNQENFQWIKKNLQNYSKFDYLEVNGYGHFTNNVAPPVSNVVQRYIKDL